MYHCLLRKLVGNTGMNEDIKTYSHSGVLARSRRECRSYRPVYDPNNSRMRTPATMYARDGLVRGADSLFSVALVVVVVVVVVALPSALLSLTAVRVVVFTTIELVFTCEFC